MVSEEKMPETLKTVLAQPKLIEKGLDKTRHIDQKDGNEKQANMVFKINQ